MKFCIAHVDDESDEPRKVSERILYDAIPYYFSKPIQNGKFHAADGGFGDVEISWDFGGVSYHVDYKKFIDEAKLVDLDLSSYDRTLFIFDVHKIDEYGTGQLLIESEKAARKLVGKSEFHAVIWTNFPNTEAVLASKIEIVRPKKNVADFAIEILGLLGLEKA